MSKLRSIGLASCLIFFAATHAQHAAAEEHEAPIFESSPHHLSLLLANTRVNGLNENGFTMGLDYEYRLNQLIGVGAVVERAKGNVDATTVLAVVDIHLWKGLAVQVGPGFERVGGTTHFAGRLGLLYELELPSGFTISPQFHFDRSEENSTVIGIAFGKAF